MAEAVALLGVAAAAIQCAQAGGQLLLLGASLRSKLQDAPDKVKRWLAQIDQLVALAELLNQIGMNLSSSPVPPLSPSSSSTTLAAPWVETALLDCKSQAQALQAILKEMLHEANDGKGQKIWKTILTATRETKIISIMNEIERQKSMLNIWLGQNNFRQLNELQSTAQEIRGGIEKVDQYMVHAQQAFHEEIQDLTRMVQANSTATKSSIENLKSLGKSNVESLKSEIQNNYNELQAEGSMTQLQLQALEKEMSSLKHEFRRMITSQSRMARSPSLLKEALDDQNSRALQLNSRSNLRRNTKKISARVPQQCSCSLSSHAGSWGLGRNIRMALTHRNTQAERCSIHKNANSRFVAFRCHMQTTMLSNLLKLSFEATHGAGGFSMGIVLRTYRTVQKHSLGPFFWGLFSQFDEKLWYDEKKQNLLLRTAQTKIWRAFDSGAASITDVDSIGQNLIYVLVSFLDLHGFNRVPMYKFTAQITKFLISMGLEKPSSSDCIYAYLLGGSRGLFDAFGSLIDVLGWTEVSQDTNLPPDVIVECMRRWPESKEDWGCPYISDILLCKSMDKLQLFISRGMKPVEENYRLLTPLHLAAAANWPEAVALLIAGGADRYALTSYLLLPIDFALYTHCSKAVKLLLDGDCTPYFDIPLIPRSSKWPAFILRGIDSRDRTIRDTMLCFLTRMGNLLEARQLYHDIMAWGYLTRDNQVVTERIFSEGLLDLELEDQCGRTPLMGACCYGDLKVAKFMINKGANSLQPHRNLGLTAGFFLAGKEEKYIPQPNLSSDDTIFRLCTELLQAAFDRTDSIKSNCRCSPEGFTPLTVLNKSKRTKKRDHFQMMMISLQWPISAVERQARAFAMGECFNRLEMTHTCINMDDLCKQISEENRHEIEDEEEEFNDQLQELMEEYDAERSKFTGGPLAFLDRFFEMHEMDLPSHQNFGWIWKIYNNNDKDLLGPGLNYQRHRYSFVGSSIFYGHSEECKEENMLALLFG